MKKQTRQQQKTQGITSKDNDNNQQIQTQDNKLLSSIDGLRPAHQPYTTVARPFTPKTNQPTTKIQVL